MAVRPYAAWRLGLAPVKASRKPGEIGVIPWPSPTTHHAQTTSGKLTTGHPSSHYPTMTGRGLFSATRHPKRHWSDFAHRFTPRLCFQTSSIPLKETPTQLANSWQGRCWNSKPGKRLQKHNRHQAKVQDLYIYSYMFFTYLPHRTPAQPDTPDPPLHPRHRHPSHDSTAPAARRRRSRRRPPGAWPRRWPPPCSARPVGPTCRDATS